MRNLFSLIFLLLIIPTSAQINNTYNFASLYHNYQGLKTSASVLYIAAHPDDENTRLISYLTHEKHYRVGYLSLTRGDGGQNLIGEEQGRDLGILRTQELLAARHIDHGEQFFTSAFDFGYSKNPEETLNKWNKEKVLQEIILVIRKFKPDVIICRFPTTGEGGHGHHTASAILAEEAFDLAADPNYHPELGSSWKSKRLFWNTFNFGSRNTTAEDQLKIDVGGYNAILGKSYGEIAAEARSQHRCQAFGSEKRRGEQFEYFKLIKGDAYEKDIMDGVVTSWQRFPELAKAYAFLVGLEKKFEPQAPQKIVKDLLYLQQLIQSSTAKNKSALSVTWTDYIQEQLSKLTIECSGLYCELNTESPFRVIQDSLKLSIQVINRSELSISLDSFRLQSHGYAINKKLVYNTANKFDYAVSGKKLSTSLSNPYPTYNDLNDSDHENKYYTQPEERDDITATVYYNIEGRRVSQNIRLLYKHIDPSFGELFQPLVHCPAATVNFGQEVVIVNKTSGSKLKVKVKSFKSNAKLTLEIKSPKGYTVTPKQQEVSIENVGEEKELEFEIRYVEGEVNTKKTISASISGENFISSFSLHTINYDHIPVQNYFSFAEIPLVTVDYQSDAKQLGYFSGAGDKIPAVLSGLGFSITPLSENDILSNNLQQYDAIIIGVRAFNTFPSLSYLIKNLLQYTENGGNLVVQYNTSHSLKSTQMGPYPFKISRDRVTEEDAAVTILKPDHPLLNYPNKISENDFSNWIQERGLYFPNEIDARYETLLSMHDSNSEDLTNALIYAQYGKGKFIYTGLSFFRELPAGVPGAIRLFINLFSNNVPKNNTPKELPSDNKKSKEKK